ncbi:uncharacterized protein LOC110448493 [Mizuhopecten yessoensis]|uniref:uncharacterized protein LOC110448493 n=1 Tax=Mizuhopecten yessoensis TaxID=6573 RepID=UPI000B45F358|nr:uncharacterized protein LOC110448493 [Mizuhopecten yessoensis]
MSGNMRGAKNMFQTKYYLVNRTVMDMFKKTEQDRLWYVSARGQNPVFLTGTNAHLKATSEALPRETLRRRKLLKKEKGKSVMKRRRNSSVSRIREYSHIYWTSGVLCCQGQTIPIAINDVLVGIYFSHCRRQFLEPSTTGQPSPVTSPAMAIVKQMLINLRHYSLIQKHFMFLDYILAALNEFNTVQQR